MAFGAASQGGRSLPQYLLLLLREQSKTYYGALVIHHCYNSSLEASENNDMAQFGDALSLPSYIRV